MFKLAEILEVEDEFIDTREKDQSGKSWKI
jgi:hypothetical protein